MTASFALPARNLVIRPADQGEEEVVAAKMRLQLPQMELVAKLVRLQPRPRLALASRSSLLKLLKSLVTMRVR